MSALAVPKELGGLGGQLVRPKELLGTAEQGGTRIEKEPHGGRGIHVWVMGQKLTM